MLESKIFDYQADFPTWMGIQTQRTDRKTLLYLALALVLALLGILTWLEWRKKNRLSDDARQRHHRRISEHLSLNQWEAADRLLRKLLKRNPTDHTAEVFLIQLLRQTKRWEEALHAIEAATLADRSSLLLLREKGKLYLEINDPQSALEAFERCRPVLRDEEDLLALANALYQEGRTQEAWETLLPLLHDSHNGQLLALAGDCCFTRSLYDQALSLYKRAHHADHNNTQILARSGHCLRRLKRFSDAEECFTAILRKDPKNISATLSLGACLEAQGQFAKALLIYQHGEAWESGDPRILRQAGICAVQTERFPHAEVYLRGAISRGGTSPQVLAFLAYSLERQAKWEEAEVIYLRLTKRYPKHVSGYRGLAWLYGVGLSQKLEPTLGLQMAQKSLELLPDLAAWEALSACQARTGNFTEAHHIQEGLASQEHSREAIQRRQRLMRHLRKGLPLDEQHVARDLVA